MAQYTDPPLSRPRAAALGFSDPRFRVSVSTTDDKETTTLSYDNETFIEIEADLVTNEVTLLEYYICSKKTKALVKAALKKINPRYTLNGRGLAFLKQVTAHYGADHVFSGPDFSDLSMVRTHAGKYIDTTDFQTLSLKILQLTDRQLDVLQRCLNALHGRPRDPTDEEVYLTVAEKADRAVSALTSDWPPRALFQATPRAVLWYFLSVYAGNSTENDCAPDLRALATHCADHGFYGKFFSECTYLSPVL